MFKKPFLQNIWNIIIGNTTDAPKHISAQEADELQKNYLEARKNSVKIQDYPPYIDVARQLFSEKSEVFKAAVFYLQRIAENESKYTEAIITILKQYAATAKRNTEDLAFLKEKIEYLEKNINFLP